MCDTCRSLRDVRACFGPNQLCSSSSSHADRLVSFRPCELLNILWEVLSLVQLCENTAYIGQNPTRHLLGAMREAAVVAVFYSSINRQGTLLPYLTAHNQHNQLCVMKNFG